MRLSYPAIISASDGAYSATIPDFEEIAVYAQSVDGIMIELDAALHEAVTIRTMRGEVLPVTSEFEQSLAYSEDEATWWTIAHCDAPNENFRRIMSGLHEIEMALTQQPVLAIGLETGPSNTDAETALGLIPGKW